MIFTYGCWQGSLGPMARKLRVEYPGAVYHVMNRGDRREPILRDDEGRQRFLDTLAQACGKTGWKVHAICLMPNHFHLVELGRRAKGDVPKVPIAVRVREETAMTVKWIADRLQMGAPAYVNPLLHCRRKAKEK